MTAYIVQISQGEATRGSIQYESIFGVGIVAVPGHAHDQHRRAPPRAALPDGVRVTSHASDRVAPRPLAKKRIRPADALFHAAILGAVVAALGVLVWLFGSVLVAGLPGLDWDFMTNPTSTSAERAGFNSAIRGSLVLMLITVMVAVPIGFAGALYLEKFASLSRVQLQAGADVRSKRVRELRARGVTGFRACVGPAGRDARAVVGSDRPAGQPPASR